MEVCPSAIPVSEVFSIINSLTGAKNSRGDAKEKLEAHRDKISACVKCGKCEETCPQNIKIRDELEKAEKIFGEE